MESKRLFQGWRIVIHGSIILFLGAAAIQAVTARLTLQNSQAIEIAEKTIIFTSAYAGLAAVIGLILAPFIDRLGSRRFMRLGIPLAGFGLIGTGLLTGSVFVYLSLSIFALGHVAGFQLPVQTATANWFISKRARALALVCGAAILFQSLFSLGIYQSGELLSTPFVVLGLGMVLILIGIKLPSSFLRRPEDHGQSSDGDKVTHSPPDSESQPGIQIPELNLTFGQALRSRSFWILILGMTLFYGFRSMAMFSRAIFLMQRGREYTLELDNVYLNSIFAVLGILLVVLFGDRYPKKIILAIIVGIQVLSVILIFLPNSFFHVHLFAATRGLGAGILPLFLAICADFFGRRSFAMIVMVTQTVSSYLGSMAMFMLFVQVLAPQTVLVLAVVLGLLSTGIFYRMKPPKEPVDGFYPKTAGSVG